MEIEKLARAIELEKELRKADFAIKNIKIQYSTVLSDVVDISEEMAMFEMNVIAKLESYKQHILDEIKAL